MGGMRDQGPTKFCLRVHSTDFWFISELCCTEFGGFGPLADFCGVIADFWPFFLHIYQQRSGFKKLKITALVALGVQAGALLFLRHVFLGKTRHSSSLLRASMPVFQKRRHGLGGKEAAKEAASKKPAASGGPDPPTGFKNGGDE